MRTLTAATALAVILAQAPARAAEAPPETFDLGPSIAFADARSAERFTRYLAFLHADPRKHGPEIATVRGLAASEVTFVVALVKRLPPETGGRLTTDGERVFVSVLDEEREDGSLDSRLAHELEHARQFDAGELGFMYDEAAGAWRPMPSSYDIGDEVLAWAAQLRTSTSSDFWTHRDGRSRPTVLKLFADAPTFAERARLLRARGYGDRNPLAFLNVGFPGELGHPAGKLVRTGGRVFARAHSPGGPRDHVLSLRPTRAGKWEPDESPARAEAAGIACRLSWSSPGVPARVPSLLH